MTPNLKKFIEACLKAPDNSLCLYFSYDARQSQADKIEAGHFLKNQLEFWYEKVGESWTLPNGTQLHFRSKSNMPWLYGRSPAVVGGEWPDECRAYLRPSTILV